MPSRCAGLRRAPWFTPREAPSASPYKKLDAETWNLANRMKLQGLDDTMTATGVNRLDDTTTALIPSTARWDGVIDRKIDVVSSQSILVADG